MSSKECLARARSFTVAATGLLMLVGAPGPVTFAADGFVIGPGVMISGLSETKPLAGSLEISEAAVARPRTSRSSTLARQSVPAPDRAASYRGAELFANSQTALPLLVSDLRPQPFSTARPMVGRSVGARPAAPWTRSSQALGHPAETGEPLESSETSWANLR
jgi:hypothetical protein